MISSLPELASRLFAFLEARCGYRCVVSNETMVRWKSASVFIQVLFDARRSCEVRLETGQLNVSPLPAGPPYTIGEILGVAGFPFEERPFLQATTEEGIEAALQKMTAFLAQYGQAFIKGDPAAFSAIARQRAVDSEEYAEERELRLLREQAQEAWQNHNYGKVVSLYRQCASHLTPSEIRRFEIAQERA